MEEEEEERLRQPPIIQEPDPEEERERRRSSRDHRDRQGEPDRAEVRTRLVHSDDEVEEGEEEEFDNNEETSDVKPRLKPTMRPITAAPSVSSASGNVSPNTPGDESPCGIIIPHENSPPDALPQEEHRPKIGLSLKLGESKRKLQVKCFCKKTAPWAPRNYLVKHFMTSQHKESIVAAKHRRWIHILNYTDTGKSIKT